MGKVFSICSHRDPGNDPQKKQRIKGDPKPRHSHPLENSLIPSTQCMPNKEEEEDVPICESSARPKKPPDEEFVFAHSQMIAPQAQDPTANFDARASRLEDSNAKTGFEESKVAISEQVPESDKVEAGKEVVREEHFENFDEEAMAEEDEDAGIYLQKAINEVILGEVGEFTPNNRGPNPSMGFREAQPVAAPVGIEYTPVPAKKKARNCEQWKQNIARVQSPEFVTYITDSKRTGEYNLNIFDISAHKQVDTTVAYELSISQEQSIVVGQSLYIICTGDYDTLKNDVLEVSLVDKEGPQFKLRANIRTARLQPLLVEYNEQYIYVMGGTSGQEDVYSCEKFDIRKNVWSMIAPLNAEKWVTRAFVLGHYIYTTISYANAPNTENMKNSLERLDIFDEEAGWNDFGHINSKEIEGSIGSWFGMAQIAPETVLFFGDDLNSYFGLCNKMRVGQKGTFSVKPVGDIMTEESEKVGRRAVVHERNAYVLSNWRRVHMFNIKTERWAVQKDLFGSFSDAPNC